ncbi:cytidylate kinase family protein [Candidatus Micrarchaeota archaeon]|nr:cytidylate kinase family protein [Candidatus Micrarchaeota archaeon]
MRITVSGQPGAGSTTTAEILLKRLGNKYKILTMGEIFKQMARERGVSPGELDKFWQTAEGKSERTHHYLDDLTRRMAASEKDIILNCKLAAFQVPDADLKVLLVAPLEVRAERKSKSDNTSYQVALDSLGKREKTERAEWKKMYGYDYISDVEQYDIIINTKTWTAEKVADMILAALESRNKR